MKFELNPFNRSVSDEELLADLVRACGELKLAGKCLTYRSYRDAGKYGPSTINARFGTWNNALRKAGLDLHEEKNVPIDVLFDNLRVVWIAKGRQPVYRDMNEAPSLYTASTYNARFGGWRRALEDFVAAIQEDEQQFTTSVTQIPTKKSGARTKRDPSLALRFLVLKRDNFRCVTCGRSPAIESGIVLEIDHILAWSKGGETVAKNLQTLCFDCNRGKSAT